MKKFIRDYIVVKLLSDRIFVPYLFFWARFVISLQKPYIIGITGSVGKTTTTEMIATVLRHEDAKPIVGLVDKTLNNMNDDVGLPLTVLRYGKWIDGYVEKCMLVCLLPFRALSFAFASRYPKILVLEYGTHWEGHLHRLAKLAPPHVAIVTTIGPAHLERLKTLEGVVWEKSALVRAVPPSGLVILGQDHSYVSHLEREAQAPVVKVSGRGTALSQGITRAVCQHLGIPEGVISIALKDFEPPKGRLNSLKLAGLTVLDDSYNANPLSMQFGLDTLAETAEPGHRRIAILGFMAELGDESVKYHEEVGAYARSRADIVLGVGELAKHYYPDYWFDSSDACADQLEELLRADDCLLVKGSYSAHMDRIVKRLRALAAKHSDALPST
jgi:UDP-N-acetylmuramoyl-tripeptide--D-alanyl-D-alanine ligase